MNYQYVAIHIIFTVIFFAYVVIIKKNSPFNLSYAMLLFKNDAISISHLVEFQ